MGEVESGDRDYIWFRFKQIYFIIWIILMQIDPYREKHIDLSRTISLRLWVGNCCYFLICVYIPKNMNLGHYKIEPKYSINYNFDAK